MNKIQRRSILAFVGLLTITTSASGQPTPYVGFVYPAGGQQGTTFQVRLGGQRIDGVYGARVTGEGVSARLLEYRKKLSNQEVSLMREQLRELKRGSQGLRNKAARNKAARNKAARNKAARNKAARNKAFRNKTANRKTPRNKTPRAKTEQVPVKLDAATLKIVTRIESRIAEWVNRPACASLSSIAILEVTISADAEPGARELRLVTQRGVTNPLVFHVGQVAEFSRKPMITSVFQVLGKEKLALRKRPAEEVEDHITIPCTMNGQIASGEVNWYRFTARKGQRLVISVNARELVPYIADAVPGWFQPVVTVYDANGKEVAFDDDYRFKPDPTLLFEVPDDGQYALTITDALYRGREDFVYRITIGEVPFITGIFPLGGRVGDPVKIEMDGWNLDKARLIPPPQNAKLGVQSVTSIKNGFVSNRMPFVRDTLPERFEKESNDDPSHAQKMELPVVVNGHMNRPDDWDVFQVNGRAGETIVAEVQARRLDSPMDSLLTFTDASGTLLAMNDDHENPESGTNTHDADSYLRVKLPADGTYYIHLGETARCGGPDYAYRLRISHLRPDFALRVAPSGVNLRRRATATITVHAIRKDGFTGDIKLRLKDPPAGFSLKPVRLKGDKDLVRIRLQTNLAKTKQPINLTIEGVAKIRGQDVVHDAVPAEDRMQAFLWRHLVPAKELLALVFNSSYKPQSKRVRAPTSAKKPAVTAAPPAKRKLKFTKRQVAGRLRQLKYLYEDWLITDDFYDRKVAECEAVRAEQ